MKIKKIKIQTRSLEDALNNLVSVAKQLQEGKNVTHQKGVYLANVETARAIFTESRLRIIHVLKFKQPKSIYDLAKLLKRDFKNVYYDVSFLAQLGILAIEKSKIGLKQKKPTLICNKILFEIAA